MQFIFNEFSVILHSTGRAKCRGKRRNILLCSFLSIIFFFVFVSRFYCHRNSNALRMPYAVSSLNTKWNKSILTLLRWLWIIQFSFILFFCCSVVEARLWSLSWEKERVEEKYGETLETMTVTRYILYIYIYV